MDFHARVVEHPHEPHVILVAVQELVKLHGVDEFQDLDLVGALSELPPHGFQNHLGQGEQPGLVCDLVILEEKPLLLIILADVLLSLGLIISHPVGPTTGFLLDLEPSFHIVLEKPLAGFRKVPDIVDVLDLVAHAHRFLEVGCALYTLKSPLAVCMRTPVGSLQGLFGHFLHIACTKGEKGKVNFPP